MRVVVEPKVVIVISLRFEFQVFRESSDLVVKVPVEWCWEL